MILMATEKLENMDTFVVTEEVDIPEEMDEVVVEGDTVKVVVEIPIRKKPGNEDVCLY